MFLPGTQKVVAFGWIKDPTDEETKKKDVQRYNFSSIRYHHNLDNISKYTLPIGGVAVYNQESLGSCTANALTTAMNIQLVQQKQQQVNLSRLYLYFKEREMEGTIESDSGAMIITGIDVLREIGTSAEHIWPYNVQRFKERPPQQADDNAKKHVVISHSAVPQNLQDLKQTLLDGFSIVFGFLVFPSMMEETGRTGVLPMPRNGEIPLGGHCVVIHGFDNDHRGGCFLIRNSWGNDWGVRGGFYMPYNFALNRDWASDFFAIKIVRVLP